MSGSAAGYQFDATEWDALVSALRDYGVRYLTGGHLAPGEQGDPALRHPVELLCRLASSSDPRLREAVAAFFLVHPELAPHAQAAAEQLAPGARERLIEAYVAAVYLQRLWRTRLRRHLGEQPDVPPYWIDEMGLPAPDAMYGRLGLAALIEHARRTRGVRPGRRNRLGPYEVVANHLFGQILAERAAMKTLKAA